MIPILTPIAAPLAIACGAASLGTHATSISIKGDWDKPGSIGTIVADTLAVVPGINAIARGAKAAKAAGSLVSVGKVSLTVKAGSRAFLTTVAGAEASEATKLFTYLGKQVAAKAPQVLAKQGVNIGKIMQAGTNLTLQTPLIVELSSGTDQSKAKDVAGGSAVMANFGQTIGSWGVVGTGFEKAGTVSIGLFSKVLTRR